MTTTEGTEFDVVVIGGGPGRLRHGPVRSSAGLSVAVVERDKVGGTCLHRGCIPAKEFLETASVMRTVAGAKEFGVQAEQPTRRLLGQPGSEAEGGRHPLQGPGRADEGPGDHHLQRDRANCCPDRRVRVTGAGRGRSRSRAATWCWPPGSVPRTIPGFEVDGRLVLTSDDVLALNAPRRRWPSSAAGPSAASSPRCSPTSGSQVTVLEALPTLLTGCDEDVVGRGGPVASASGGSTSTPGCRSPATARTDRGRRSASATASPSTVDAVVVSVGRRPLTAGLVAEGTGVDDRRAGLRGGRRVHADRRPKGCGRSGTWSTPRSWPTSASPKGS